MHSLCVSWDLGCRTGAFPSYMIGTGHLHLCWVISYSSRKFTHRCRTEIEALSLCCACECFCFPLYAWWESLCAHCLSASPALGSHIGVMAICDCLVSARMKFKKEEKRQSHWVVLTCPGGTKKPSDTTGDVPGLRRVGTLGGVTWSSLRPGQWLPLALSRSDWDNSLSTCKPGGIQTH